MAFGRAGSPVFFAAPGRPVFPFSFPSQSEGMERREAPGRWCYAALWRALTEPAARPRLIPVTRVNRFGGARPH
jgi:hypothetical protein